MVTTTCSAVTSTLKHLRQMPRELRLLTDIEAGRPANSVVYQGDIFSYATTFKALLCVHCKTARLHLVALAKQCVVTIPEARRFFFIQNWFIFLLASYIFKPASLSSLHSCNLQFEKRSGNSVVIGNQIKTLPSSQNQSPQWLTDTDSQVVHVAVLLQHRSERQNVSTA